MQQETAVDGVFNEQPPEQSPEYIQCLQSLVHSWGTLKQKGFIIDQLSASDLEKRKRCRRCCRALNAAKQKKTADHKRRSSTSPSRAGSAFVPGYRDRTSMSANPASDSFAPRGKTTASNSNAKLECRYHDGEMDRKTKKWTCCNMSMFTKPCKATEDHDPRRYRPSELETNWRFHHTPPATPQSPARVAVVFDCEMGVTDEGESELIRVSVVDYFTSAVLLDSLVWPDVKMKDLSTPFSGVSWKALNDARRNKTCIFGREKARKAVWSLISPETVVIGHGANNDLNILRWIHPNIVDTLLVEQSLRAKENETKDQESKIDDEQVAETKTFVGGGGGGGGMSLKKLAKDRLGRAIQAKGRGHDSIEDSIATRDILHWHVSRMLQSGES